MRSLEELIEEQRRLPPVLPEARKALAAIPGVVGVGLGFSARGSQLTEEIALLVYVRKKRPLAEIPESERIPRSFGGVPTDVLECVSALSIQSGAPDPGRTAGGSIHADRRSHDLGSKGEG